MQSRKSPRSTSVNVRHSFSKSNSARMCTVTSFDIVKSMAKEKEGLV